MKEIIILYDVKTKRDRKIKEIEKILYEPKEEKYYYKPININNTFNNNYIEYDSNGDKDKTLSIKEYLDMIKQYLIDIIKNHKTQDQCKAQLIIKTNFYSFKDSNEIRTMHTISDRKYDRQ